MNEQEVKELEIYFNNFFKNESMLFGINDLFYITG